MITVLIVDDDPGFQGIVKHLLEEEPAVCVVGEAENGEEALRLAPELRPDIILMDLAMPHVNGLEVTRQIKTDRPETEGHHPDRSQRRGVPESGRRERGGRLPSQKDLADGLVPHDLAGHGRKSRRSWVGRGELPSLG